MKLNFRFFDHRYYIVLQWNYCGGIVRTLEPRAGETWLRGNDLLDGKLWELPSVLWDVICYEFKIGRWKGH